MNEVAEQNAKPLPPGVAAIWQDILPVEDIVALQNHVLRFSLKRSLAWHNVIRQELLKGIASKVGARALGRTIETKVLGNLKRYEAERIARTEMLRAANQGALTRYRSAGVQTVMRISARDDRVREEHINLDGTIYTVEEARGVLPDGVNCRCTFIPAAF